MSKNKNHKHTQRKKQKSKKKSKQKESFKNQRSKNKHSPKNSASHFKNYTAHLNTNDYEIIDTLPIDEGVLRILPLGGLGEIGMNCMVLESKHEIIVIDCGVMFSDLDHFGIEFVIPGFKYLIDRRDKIKAIIFTHGHEDHIGAIPYLLKQGVVAPIYASRFTSLMLREKLSEHGLLEGTDIFTFKMGEQFLKTKDFKVESTSVNHSIVDAAALFIDTPVGQVVHTGDFRIDPTPYFGSQLEEARFKKAGSDGVVLLLSDSTNVERCEVSMSESVVYSAFEELFSAAQGLTLVAMFSSNVARMAQIFEIAKKQNKKVALTGRSMEQNFKLALESGHIQNAQGVLIPLDDVKRHSRSQVIVLTTGTQGEYRSALNRVANNEHSLISLEKGDRVLMSSRFIPGNEKLVGRMINMLFKRGAQVLYESTHQIHASGHATRPELKKMIEWTKPKFFLPIHGEYRHLVHHAEVARETGMKEEQIKVVTNGAILEIRKDDFQFVYQMEEEPRTFIDGMIANEITKEVLKDRRKLAETGVVLVLFTMDQETGTPVSGPQVICKGAANRDLETDIIDKTYKILRRVFKECKNSIIDLEMSLEDLNEELRVEIRRMVMELTSRKAVVVVMGLPIN